MALTIDITGMPAERLAVAASPLAELGAMLHVLAAPAHHPALQPWAAGVMAACKPSFTDRLLEAEFLWHSSRADFLVPGSPRATLAEELDDVDALSDETYVAAALVTTCGCSRLSFRRGEPDRLKDLARARGPAQAAFAERLLDDPGPVRARVRRLLEDCVEEFFGEAWRRVAFDLAADARRMADLHERQGLGAALAAMSPAMTLAGSRIVLDKLQDSWTTAEDGMTFIPTAFGRPHLVSVYAPGSRPVVQYPTAADESVPLDVVRRRIDAFAHPVRLRLCRTLARGPRTTGELAEAWQLSAPEVSRHLAVLKKAGLTVTTRRGRYVSHQLDLSATAALGVDLIAVLLR
ncbi:DUF5937 family protein [Couchioplanes caeruleus]|uniref:Transcriptional regulator n=2 Tax=Couchioplanes caeruleus TaxID=56438 RepID=A0A1K0GUR3_9ACTN|nr:DUF5937 family protein [Couchioplanes caeruleus]OJF16246.1 transcriptional regulator [Couchioplanes caeruleus subsp. caeruleus]ROP28799.1 DNA-binding transcriptional ArsR family regulator [Couchioplanes caeruleus]